MATVTGSALKVLKNAEKRLREAELDGASVEVSKDVKLTFTKIMMPGGKKSTQKLVVSKGGKQIPFELIEDTPEFIASLFEASKVLGEQANSRSAEIAKQEAENALIVKASMGLDAVLNKPVVAPAPAPVTNAVNEEPKGAASSTPAAAKEGASAKPKGEEGASAKPKGDTGP